MTRTVSDKLVKALAAAELEELRTMRRLEEALTAARARLVEIEQQRKRDVAEALAEEGGECG